MAKKPISQKRAEREEKENRTLRQVFDAFLLGLAAECYLLIVYRGYGVGSVSSMITWYYILYWGSIVGLVLAVAGVAMFFLGRGRSDRTGRVLGKAAPWCFGAGLFLAVTGWVMCRFFGETIGVTAMCMMVPILTVLALIFLLYQHECFLCTIALSGTLFAVWARGATSASNSWRVPVIAGAVFGAVVLVAAAALCRKAQQDGGKLWGVRVCSVDCDYRIVYAVLAAGFVCVLAALAAPGLAYYLMWAAGIVLFAELVYYTTQMM